MSHFDMYWSLLYEKQLVLLIEFKAQLKFRYHVRPLGFISVIATTVGLLDIHM